jgi:hypothetical protein
MTDFSYNIFKDVNHLSIGSAVIKTAADNSQTIMNVNPYTNHGQHASGGRIDNYNEERRPVSAQDIVSPSMAPESKPAQER